MPTGLAAALQTVLSLLGAYLAALWFCLVVWTFRDIRSRTPLWPIQVLSTILVLAFNVPGLVLYMILRPPLTIDEASARAIELDTIRRQRDAIPVCPSCRATVEHAFIRCPECGVTLKRRCGSCERPIGLDWRLCPYCGVDSIVAAAISPIESARVQRTN